MINNKFELSDRVKILPLEYDGVVTAVLMDCLGLGYKVRYFNQGKCEETYFFDWELEKKS